MSSEAETLSAMNIEKKDCNWEKINHHRRTATEEPLFSKHPHGTLMQAQAPHAGTLAKRMVCGHCVPATIKSKTSSLYIACTMTKNIMTKLSLLAETLSMLLVVFSMSFYLKHTCWTSTH